MEHNLPQLGPASGHPFLHNNQPSSPPASPPRQRQHSNSISESLSDGLRLQTTIDRSQLLEYSVLRAYPPANPSRRRVTPPQSRLVVPPSPPESLIASGTRRYRSASSATVKTMPPQEEEPDPVPIISSLKGRLNRALSMRRGHHSRQSSDAVDLEAGKSLTPTTVHTQSPQSAPNSATTANLSAVTTAHTSFYSHTFPVPDILPEEKGGEATTDSNSSYALDTYYGGASGRSKSTVKDLGGYDTTCQSPTTRVNEDRNFDVMAGEVRIEIRRPFEKDENPNLQINYPPRDIYRHDGLMEGPSDGNVVEGNIAPAQGKGGAGFHGVGSGSYKESIPVNPLGLRRYQGYSNLRDRTGLQVLPVDDPSFTSSDDRSQNTEDLANDTVEYFEELASGYTPGGIKKAISSQTLESSRTQNTNTSSSLLGDGSLHSRQRPGALDRSYTSSSSNIFYSSTAERPSPRRLLTGQPILSAERTSSIDPSDAAEIVRCLSTDLGRRLSAALSSSGTSVKSNSALGAGFAVVLTTDGAGDINNLSGHLVSITDEGDEGDSISDEHASGGPGWKDKGKGRAISEKDEKSNGESSESSKDEGLGGTLGNSGSSLEVSDGNFKLGGQGVLVHPGDERYDFVYRIRPSSPNNQPLLVPFYNTSPTSNFPYCNALISSLPQKSKLQQLKDTQAAAGYSKPTLQTPHQRTHYAGETPPSHVEKAFVRPAADAPYVRPPIEDLNEHRARLKKVASKKEVLLEGSSKGVPNARRDVAITLPGDGAADTSTSDPDVDNSLGVLPLTPKSSRPRVLKDARPFFHSNLVDNFNLDFDQAMSSLRSEPRLHSDQPNPEASTTFYPSSPPEPSFIGPKTAHNSHCSSTYSNNSISGENLSVYESVSIHNYEDTSVILRHPSSTRGPMEIIAKSNQTGTAPDIQIIPPSSPGPNQHLEKLEGLDELELLRSRLRSVEIFDDRDQNLRIGRRQFDSAPHLVSKSYPHQPEERILPRQPEVVKDSETLRMQQKYSRVLLFLCCLFPPLLYVLAYGAMDHMMLSFTDGRVAHVGVFYKRVAFVVGTVVGSICCCIPIVCGILAAKGAL